MVDEAEFTKSVVALLSGSREEWQRFKISEARAKQITEVLFPDEPPHMRAYRGLEIYFERGMIELLKVGQLVDFTISPRIVPGEVYSQVHFTLKAE